MKRVVLMIIVFLGICSSVYSQGLTNNQKEKIIHTHVNPKIEKKFLFFPIKTTDN